MLYDFHGILCRTTATDYCGTVLQFNSIHVLCSRIQSDCATDEQWQERSWALKLPLWMPYVQSLDYIAKLDFLG